MIQICETPDKCTGCGACANVCPKDAVKLQENNYGFLHPVIDEKKCIECNLCSKTCKKVFDMELIYPLKAYACTIKDKDILMKSSSGGAFSVLAEHILENGGAVCGCVYDDELKPIHICSEKKDDYLLMRKSKYVQSDTGLVYRDAKERLEAGKTVLFTGTPCQVGALKGYLGKGYENLITVDLICHGVPSYAMFREFVKYLENKHKTKITDFNFRSKKYTWQRITAEFTDFKGKTKNIGKNDEFYMYGFSVGNLMRPSCFECRYATENRIGDITLGDFWGHNRVKLSCDRINGISVCMFNNEKAMSLLSVLSSKMTTEEVDYNAVVNGNTCLRHPTVKGTKWDKYMDACKNGRISDIAKQYRKNNLKGRLRSNMKLHMPLGLFNLIKKL
ncbi:MAG: Coenzyme F420 hydrogenase/dehydrogenase, beta subunit C-terminal domain [Oscillospiraceae bacterium]|nr:Coenzyme F420 hydrogenase/dehydrogenase, beta subunit C-terminal domain [Oscillospiraceae bacterium]